MMILAALLLGVQAPRDWQVRELRDEGDAQADVRATQYSLDRPALDQQASLAVHCFMNGVVVWLGWPGSLPPGPLPVALTPDGSRAETWRRISSDDGVTFLQAPPTAMAELRRLAGAGGDVTVTVHAGKAPQSARFRMAGYAPSSQRVRDACPAGPR